MIETNIPCRRCGEPMIGIEFARHYRIVCDNLGCLLYREDQDIIEKEVQLGTINTFISTPLSSGVSPPKGDDQQKG
jgi:hypothetical protein